MLPEISPATADALRTALDRADYRTDGVRGLLGREAHAALGRGEPEPAFRATADGGPLGVLVRMLLLGSVEPDAAVAAALAPLAPADAAAAGLLRRDGEGWAAALDLRPHGADEGGEWWVLSDLDARRQERDHVTGVGGASLTLASATPRTPVGTVLDLGTGCGVQALHAARHARAVTATDVAPRALAMARATFALNDLDVELLDGPWLAPVGGRRFDLIVSNPPFVPGPARVDYVYRDSGQAGDDALAALVRALPAHLEPGGVAQLLGSWLHVRGEDWPDRVRSWLPDGVDAWIVQREVTDPALHVGTWQRDAGLDLHSPAARAQAGAWLDWLAAQKVEAVGFGFLTLADRRAARRRRPRWSSRTCPTISPTRSAPRSRAGSTASTGSARTRRTTPCSTPGCGSPTAWCSSGTRRPATTAGSRRAPWSPGRRGRGGGTRWTSRPPRCSRAAGARCRSATSWSCWHSRTTGRSMRWSPPRCPRCARWCGTGCWSRVP